MAFTKFVVCSRALNKIGIKSIDSFEDGTNAANICADLWPTYSEYLLSIYPWYFTMAKSQLAKLITTPVNEYKYEFQLPGDYLSIRAVYDNDGQGAYPILDFDLFGVDLLYANSDQIWIDYQKYVIAEGWPTWFVQFAISAFAYELALQIPVHSEKTQMLKQEAWGSPSDNMNGGMFGFVKNIDSKMRPAEPIMEPELITARYFG